MTMSTDTAMPALLLGEAGSDPIEDRMRATVRATIEAPFDEERLHDELTEDCRDMIYAETAAEVETRKAFLRKWRLKCRAVADSLEEAGERLFAFTRLDPSQWKSARTTNAVERLSEEFRRHIKTQTVLPCAETVPILLWALLASGQIAMRKVDGWETLSQPIEPFALDRAA